MPDGPSITFVERSEWRAWLAENHAIAAGVWLISWKKKTGKPTVAYEDAVEEALCFGWIDGQYKPLDDERTAQWFAPRRPKSTWAKSNKERVARLEADGLMTDAGRRVIEIARANGSWDSLNASDAEIVPEELAAALEVAGVREAFDASTGSVRRAALNWVYQAKRPETKATRVRRIVATLSRGQKLFDAFTARD
jgi:uncharacterized protein YdeI (YjbR/CyaY-like superfamily)